MDISNRENRLGRVTLAIIALAGGAALASQPPRFTVATEDDGLIFIANSRNTPNGSWGIVQVQPTPQATHP